MPMDETADPAEVRERMWEKMAKSPFVMVSLVGVDQHAEPLTAQLDEDVTGKFWFYTRKDNRIAPGGPAMAHEQVRQLHELRDDRVPAEPLVVLGHAHERPMRSHTQGPLGCGRILTVAESAAVARLTPVGVEHHGPDASQEAVHALDT